MSGFVTVGSAEQVDEGEIGSFDVASREIAVARIDGALFAFSDVCTHRRCNLSLEGELDGTAITCGCHGSSFDLTSGSVLAPPAEDPLPIFGVREVDGRIEVEL